jgi:flagellar FliL protein
MSKRAVILLTLVTLLFMGTMGAGFYILWEKVSQIQKQASTANGEATDEETDEIGPLYALDTMIVNLADHGGKRYLRVTMALELSSPDVVGLVETRLPQIRDAILMILPTKKYAEISTTDGKVALRSQVMEKINSLLLHGGVANLYFTEFVVQ